MLLYFYLLTDITHICEKFLLWCDENWGYFFDDPISNSQQRNCGLSSGNCSNLEEYPAMF
jgi:hypothetical protein